jgi:hypothetical protein
VYKPSLLLRTAQGFQPLTNTTTFIQPTLSAREVHSLHTAILRIAIFTFSSLSSLYSSTYIAMKFFSVSVLALSLVSQIVAQPILTPSARNTQDVVEGPLESIFTSLSSAAGAIAGDIDTLGIAIKKFLQG